MTELKRSGSIAVAVAPDQLYALVSDVTKTGQWSPVCTDCWWDEGAGPQVGSWFTGRNEADGRTWETRSQVVAADPGRRFAWEVNNGWVYWGYTFEPDGDGTLLTEWWEFLPAGVDGFHQVFGEAAEAEIAARSEAARTGIPVTLAAIKRTAESG